MSTGAPMREPHVVALHYTLETGSQFALALEGAMRLLRFPSRLESSPPWHYSFRSCGCA